MNHLDIGLGDKTQRLLEQTNFREPLLLIDDGPIADVFLQHIPSRRKPYVLDWERDGFNPLTERKYLWELLPYIFPRTNTLTREDADFLWQSALALLDHNATLFDITTLLSQRRVLTRDDYLQNNWNFILSWERKRYDAAVGRVIAQISTMLMNPTLRRALTKTATFPNDKIIIAKIDRARWGEFDAFMLANFLIGQARGQIIIPNFGALGRDLHMSLLRQNRLTVGVNFLEELPTATLQQAILSIQNKTAYRTTLADAEELLPYFHHCYFNGEHRTITKPSQFIELADGDYLTTGTA